MQLGLRVCLEIILVSFFLAFPARLVQSSVFAETYAVLVGVKEVLLQKVEYLWLELDSAVLLDMLKERSTFPWNIYYLVKNIKRLLKCHLSEKSLIFS